jgi:hypothetical protein
MITIDVNVWYFCFLILIFKNQIFFKTLILKKNYWFCVIEYFFNGKLINAF